jgi:hypothetical protein
MPLRLTVDVHVDDFPKRKRYPPSDKMNTAINAALLLSIHNYNQKTKLRSTNNAAFNIPCVGAGGGFCCETEFNIIIHHHIMNMCEVGGSGKRIGRSLDPTRSLSAFSRKVVCVAVAVKRCFYFSQYYIPSLLWTFVLIERVPHSPFELSHHASSVPFMCR